MDRGQNSRFPKSPGRASPPAAAAAAPGPPIAIIGDFNAVGPVGLQGFRDIGPRARTHRAGNIIALRLDRCIARGLECRASEVLDKGPSDHHPMVLDMAVSGALHVPTIEESTLIGAI